MKAKTVLLGAALATALMLGERTEATASPKTSKLLAHMSKTVVVHLSTGHVLRGKLVFIGKDHISLKLGSGKLHRIARRSIKHILLDGNVGSAGNQRLTEKVTQPTGKVMSRARVARLLYSANVVLSVGTVLILTGVAGGAGSIVWAVKAKKEAEQSAENYTCGLHGDQSCEHEPHGYWVPVAVMAGLVGIAGIVMVIHGATKARKWSRALKRFRPRVDIDPTRGRYTVSMRVSF